MKILNRIAAELASAMVVAALLLVVAGLFFGVWV